MDIELKNVSKSYDGKPVLQDFSAVFPEGKVSAIMAPSGKGKTTLLRLILGLEAPDSGSITGVPEEKSALFQEDRLCPALSVLTNIRMVTGKTVPEQTIGQLLEELGLEAAVHAPACRLSGGMARRAALARALLHRGRLLTLDEPFNGLDGQNRIQAAQAILRYASDRTVLLVTHHPSDLELLKVEKQIIIE